MNKLTFAYVEPTKKLFNNNFRITFKTTHYTHIKKINISPLGNIYLAPMEHTVLLPESSIQMAKIHNLSDNDILNMVNKINIIF